MKKIQKFILSVNELSFISLILVLSALIYTVYVLNSPTPIPSQTSRAQINAGAVCSASFTAVK